MTQQNDPQSASRPDPNSAAQAATAKVIPLRIPNRWHDPLKLIQNEAPSQTGRIVLWVVSILIIALITWAAFGKLDIIVSAEGKLAPQTLIKIVQPAESGIVKQLLVQEGDTVKAGQILAKLDSTLATAEKTGIASDLGIQQLQVRRIEAELSDQPMQVKTDDNPQQYAQVQNQYSAHRKAFRDAVDQEQSLLVKAEYERKSASEIQSKLEQTLPTYQRSAEAYAKLEKEGFFSGLASAEKQRDAIEKSRDLAAQQSTVAALNATISAQTKKIRQLQSVYQSDLQKELADIRARIAQLQPSLDKTLYKEGLMELRAPQDGIIKDLATTTIGAVVQPGTVVMTLVPKNELLFADVAIKNEEVGFVRIGQTAQIKLATYPFQRYGMLTGKVIFISADATETGKQNAASANATSDSAASAGVATYKARLQLDQQTLKDPQGTMLALTPGMQIAAEINQGKRTVLEYLLSPVRKTVQEAGRER